MYRIISNMLLVLFAVALGLPASKGKRSSFDPFGCYHALSESGNIYCQLSGYDKSVSGGLDYRTCELKCEGGSVELPEEACPYDGVDSGCTKKLTETLTRWNAEMTKRKNDLINKWCTSAKQV
uniref:Putative ixodes 10 kDa peptide protein n=1 Tax=Ixodes ricinus TaxID=34613 RepID=A0A0K8RD84_IXORI